MPFGIHRKTGRRYGFYLDETKPLATSLREQLRLFDSPQTISQEVIKRFSAYAPQTRRRGSTQPDSDKVSAKNGEDLPLHEQLKAAISVRDFVSNYVRLSPSGAGLCPFHDDQVESFSVEDSRNFWCCFACEKGGSLIDFWMNYQECDFKTAMDQLATMLF